MSDQQAWDEERRAARYSDLFGDHHGHTPDCAYCPICTGVALVRHANPEVLDHLAAAAREFMIAAGLFLEEAGNIVGSAEARREQSRDAAEGDGKVRRIDIG